VKQASLAFLFASLSVPALAGGTMTMDGLGKVHLGMTLKGAGRALGARLVVSPDYDDPSECSYANRADGRDANVAYMLHRDRIVRIDVDSRTAGKSFVDVRTEAGIGIGSSEADIRRAYGRRAKVGPHPYGDRNDHYYRLDDNGRNYGIIFETWDGKVSEFRVGGHHAIEYIEGCS